MQHDLAGTHYKVATLLAQQGEAKPALEQFQLARAIMARLKEQLPEILSYLTILPSSIAKLRNWTWPKGQGQLSPLKHRSDTTQANVGLWHEADLKRGRRNFGFRPVPDIGGWS